LGYGDKGGVMYDYGEIVLSEPKVINWVEMPSMIGEEENVEFLKKDILIRPIGGKLEELFQSKKYTQKNTAYFYNLDRIFRVNSVRNENVKDFLRDLIYSIKEISGAMSLVHTNMINPALSGMFREEGIPYIEKNLEDRANAYNTTVNLVKPLFSFNNQVIRSYLRVELLHMRYKVELYRTDNYKINSVGFLKDASLNGIGLVLGNVNDLNFFSLKDKITIKLFISHYLIKINYALVTRIDCENCSLGVNFNLNDTSMVNVLDADNYSKLLFKWLKDAREKHIIDM